jgi:ubiquinone/menaquinone biosynthesis C-methylase UbiE
MPNLWWRIVRFGFRLLYNELAFTYDTVSNVVSLGQWRCWQRTALAHLPPPNPATPLLDLAHGTGNFHQDLITAGYPVIGYDLSAAMGRITTRKLQRHRYPVRLVRGYAQTLPFADGAVGAIVCTFPTPFIFQPATLTELHRILQPDGTLIIVVAATLTGGNPAAATLEWLYRITGQRPTHPPQTNAHIRTAFTDAGFNVQLLTEPCPASTAHLIRATKPNLA